MLVGSVASVARTSVVWVRGSSTPAALAGAHKRLMARSAATRLGDRRIMVMQNRYPLAV